MKKFDPVGIIKDARGEFRFRIKGENGEIVATGESYTRKADALRGVKTLRAILLGDQRPGDGDWQPYEEPLEENYPAELARGLEWKWVRIRRSDLPRLDAMITLFDCMAALGADAFYDDAWNLRNQMVPFEAGEQHFDVDDDGGPEA